VTWQSPTCATASAAEHPAALQGEPPTATVICLSIAGIVPPANRLSNPMGAGTPLRAERGAESECPSLKDPSCVVPEVCNAEPPVEETDNTVEALAGITLACLVEMTGSEPVTSSLRRMRANRADLGRLWG
jgi:hypothetical protein